LILFLIVIFNPAKFHPNEAHFYVVVSFLIILLIGVLIMIFFDRMVTSTEKNILAKNRELIKTNQELDRFVYSASHDLRAPLTSMAGLIHLAQRDPSEAQNYLLLMHERLKVMDNYIKEIVEYSRNARTEVVLTEVPLKSLVQEVVQTLKYSTDLNKVNIVIRIDDSLNAITDRPRLQVILNNLIGNGFKYQDFSKTQPFLLIGATVENGRCVIKIEDNGIGIRQEHHQRLFGMFYRANDTVAGSGLGLYIAKEAAEKTNGIITFVSEYGKGSTFTVSLPA
jgi:signal transduction histidine kinase